MPPVEGNRAHAEAAPASGPASRSPPRRRYALHPEQPAAADIVGPSSSESGPSSSIWMTTSTGGG
jgi:hypothetical protein